MLLSLTLLATLLVVAALAGYLIAVVVALRKADATVKAIADGLEAVAGHTGPLEEKLTIINGALSALHRGLASADSHLGRAAATLRLG